MNMFNQFQNNNRPPIKQLLKYVYDNNKLLIILMALVVVASAFLGDNFFHILYNVSLLYFSGVMFKQYLGEMKMIYKLLFGFVAGIALYLLIFSNAIDYNYLFLAGISGAVLSITAAIGTYLPELVIPLFGSFRVKLKYLVLVLVGLEALTINFVDPSPRVSALGGAVYGFISMLIAKNYNFGKLFSNPFNNLFSARKGPYYNRRKDNYRKNKTQKETDDDYNKRQKEEQKEIDKILEKVKQNGYASLTSEEKRKLFDKSNN